MLWKCSPQRVACAGAALLVLGAVGIAAAALPMITFKAPAAVLSLEVARSDPDREHGLMNRKVLPKHHGMIFVFDQDQPQYFWMKNTLVPLDMVFVDSKNDITSIADHVPAMKSGMTDSTFPRREGYGRFVIELPAGEADTDGLFVGLHLPLPVFP